MNIQYCFSSPDGDIILTPEDLARPFLLSSTEAHPFLTLGDYFKSIKAFILKHGETALVSLLKGGLKKEAVLDNIQGLLIRSEKHGALYHPASVEMMVQEQLIKLTVSTAVSQRGKKWLAHEYEILNYLNNTLNLPYLPRVYVKGEIECRGGNNQKETSAMLLAEWFEDYHEWHFSIDDKDNTQIICIWDLKNGNRYASEKETFEIIKQASKILTFYYDTSSFKQIHPWHHAAGDFIVKTHDGDIDVKLTTARKYESIMDYFSEDAVNPIIAIIYFFLNMTIKMRLDRLDGVGRTTWAGDFSVNAATEGFFEALQLMETKGRYKLSQVKDLLTLLQSFNEKELERLFQSLLNLYQEDDPEDLAVIQENLGKHVSLLNQVLRNFHK